MPAWAQTQGRLLTADITSSERYDSSTNSSTTYHEPVVTYHYEVNGVQYTGTRVNDLLLGYGSLSAVQKFLADHPIGSTVTVVYDPADPTTAILETRSGSIKKHAALAGVPFVGTLAVIVGFMLSLSCVIALFVLLISILAEVTLFQFLGS